MIIKIFAVIGIVFVALIMANFLCYAEEKIKKWRENDCKIKILCNPHVYEYYWMWLNGELILKCKKCGKIKRLRVDVENWNKMIDRKVAERNAETDKELLSWFLARLFKKDVISAETEIEAGKQIGKFLYDVRWKEIEE